MKIFRGGQKIDELYIYIMVSPHVSVLKAIIDHRKNIAKGTTDPRVEFILPKSYCKFKHKS